MAALAPKHIDIPLALGGVSTKIDKKIVESPKLLQLENGELTSPGAISKRPAYVALEPADMAGNGMSFFAFGKRARNLVGIGSEDYIGEYSPALSKWTSQVSYRVPTTESRILRTSKELDHMKTDSVYANGLLFVVATETGATDDARLYVFDGVTNVFIKSMSVETGAAGAITVKLGVIGNEVFAFYVDGTDLEVHSVTATAAGINTGLSGATTLKADVDSLFKMFDVHYEGSLCYVAYVKEAEGPHASTFSMDDSKTVLNTHDWAAGVVDKCISVYHHSSLARVMTSVCGSAGVQSAVYDESISLITSGVASVGATDCWNVIGASYSSTFFIVVYELTAADAIEGEINWTFVDAATGPTGTIRATYGVNLAHKAAPDAANDSCVFGISREIGVLEGDIYYTVQFDANGDNLLPIGKYQHGTAAGRGTTGADNRLPQSVVPGIAFESAAPMRWHWAPIIRVAAKAAAGTIYKNLSVGRATYEINPAKTYQNVEHGNLMPWASGLPQAWDGEHTNEIGFSHAPRIKAAPPTVGSGSIAAGFYRYIAVYEYMDAFGQLHRSQPSLSFPATATGLQVGVGDTNEVTIETYAPVRPRAAALDNEPIVAVYRTLVGATSAPSGPYYRASPHEILGGGVNFNDALTSSFLDQLADMTIEANEILYTEADVLQNYAPPPSDVFATHQNRLCVISNEDGSMWYSKEFTDGEGPAFNPVLRVPTNVQDVRPVAVASMGHANVLFWPNSIGVVYGEGQNDLGLGGTYTIPQMIPGNIGCDNRRSVVKVPDGIMFHADTGFYLLPNSLGPPQYVGADVEIHNAVNVVSADLIESQNQVRFTTAGRIILVYNYLIKQWLTFPEVPTTSLELVDAIVWDNAHVLMWKPAAPIYLKQTAGVYKDEKPGPSVPYDVVLSSPWIKLAGLQGFQRIWKAWILGEYIGAHDLKVSIYYDYIDASPDVLTFDSVELATLAPYEVRVDIPQQRCTAIRFKIEVDATTDSLDSAGANITGIRLGYGVLRGAARLPAAARA